MLARNPARAEQHLGTAVELITRDITKPDTLIPAVQDTNLIIFTAGVRRSRIAREGHVKMTDYPGVLNTLEATPCF